MVDLISCEACGNSVSAAAAACPKCGHPQSKPRPKVSYEIEDETKLSGAQRIGLGVIAVLVILGGMFWVLNKINIGTGGSGASGGQEIASGPTEFQVGEGIDFGKYTVTVESVDFTPMLGLKIEEARKMDRSMLADRVIASTLMGMAPSGGGVFVIVDYVVQNSSKQPLAPSERPSMQLLDQNGTLLEGEQTKTALMSFGAKALSDLNPGTSESLRIVFEVSSEQFSPATWKLVVDGGGKVSLASLEPLIAEWNKKPGEAPKDAAAPAQEGASAAQEGPKVAGELPELSVREVDWGFYKEQQGYCAVFASTEGLHPFIVLQPGSARATLNSRSRFFSPDRSTSVGGLNYADREDGSTLKIDTGGVPTTDDGFMPDLDVYVTFTVPGFEPFPKKGILSCGLQTPIKSFFAQN